MGPAGSPLARQSTAAGSRRLGLAMGWKPAAGERGWRCKRCTIVAASIRDEEGMASQLERLAAASPSAVTPVQHRRCHRLVRLA